MQFGSLELTKEFSSDSTAGNLTRLLVSVMRGSSIFAGGIGWLLCPALAAALVPLAFTAVLLTPGEQVGALTGRAYDVHVLDDNGMRSGTRVLGKLGGLKLCVNDLPFSTVTPPDYFLLDTDGDVGPVSRQPGEGSLQSYLHGLGRLALPDSPTAVSVTIVCLLAGLYVLGMTIFFSQVLGFRQGLVAGLFSGLLPGLSLYYAVLLMSELLMLAAIAWALVFMERYKREERISSLAVAAVLAGLAMAMKFNAVLYIPFVVLGTPLPRRLPVRHMVLAGTLFLLPIIPHLVVAALDTNWFASLAGAVSGEQGLSWSLTPPRMIFGLMAPLRALTDEFAPHPWDTLSPAESIASVVCAFAFVLSIIWLVRRDVSNAARRLAVVAAGSGALFLLFRFIATGNEEPLHRWAQVNLLLLMPLVVVPGLPLANEKWLTKLPLLRLIVGRLPTVLAGIALPALMIVAVIGWSGEQVQSSPHSPGVQKATVEMLKRHGVVRPNITALSTFWGVLEFHSQGEIHPIYVDTYHAKAPDPGYVFRAEPGRSEALASIEEERFKRVCEYWVEHQTGPEFAYLFVSDHDSAPVPGRIESVLECGSDVRLSVTECLSEEITSTWAVCLVNVVRIGQGCKS